MENKPIKISICGAAGKMGRTIISLAQNDPEIVLVGGVDVVSALAATRDGIRFSSRLGDFISETDVVIDFSTPAATMANLEIIRKNARALVLGTTGFKPAEVDRITSLSGVIPIVFSPNMSVGVNILFRLVKDVSKIIPGYEVEIVELHHDQKRDAPSGTANKLAQIIADERGQKLSETAVYGRQGICGPRPRKEIGIMAVRAGDIVGEHTVYFAAGGERLEITHRAHSRDCFAAGALRAAKWIVGKTAGLYDMTDVLDRK